MSAMARNVTTILRGLSAWLRFQKEMGVDALPLGPGTSAFLDGGGRVDPWFRAVSQAGDLATLSALASSCNRCPLHATRNKLVFGQGDPHARLVVVGEAPGREEDLQGLPFVGPSGDLLTRMLQAVGIGREEVFITSAVKCRPPGNRTPRAEEMEACSPLLFQQLRIIDPGLVLALGQVAACTILGARARLRELRGKVHEVDGFRVVVTYHPAFLLRFRGAVQKSYKREAWQDLQMLKGLYEGLG